jgi:hypothetical protein
MTEETPTVCPHTNLVKQTGPMDGGAASTRYRCGVALGLRDLVAKWREGALACVPPEYAERRLHYKYLKLDNYAAGLDDAADELDKALAKLVGCGAFFVVAPHEIGVSIGPPEPSSRGGKGE